VVTGPLSNLSSTMLVTPDADRFDRTRLTKDFLPTSTTAMDWHLTVHSTTIYGCPPPASGVVIHGYHWLVPPLCHNLWLMSAISWLIFGLASFCLTSAHLWLNFCLRLTLACLQPSFTSVRLCNNFLLSESPWRFFLHSTGTLHQWEGYYSAVWFPGLSFSPCSVLKPHTSTTTHRRTPVHRRTALRCLHRTSLHCSPYSLGDGGYCGG
jgi:hypothetical protein